MSKVNLDNIALELLFEKQNEFYIKEVDGYLFSLIKTIDKQILLVSVLNYCFDANDSKFKDFHKSLGIKLISTVVKNDTILIKASGKNDIEVSENIALSMKTLIEYFKENDIRHNHQCWFCGEATDESICIKGFHVHGHVTCKENYKKAATEQINSNENYNENRSMSIILSFLGAFIGLIPFILIFFLTGYYFSLLIAIPPVSSYYGYKLGKAKPDSKATICSIVFSFIAVMTGYALLIVLLKQYNNDLSYIDLIIGTIGDLIFMLVSYGLGIMISYRYISKNTENIKKEIDKL